MPGPKGFDGFPPGELRSISLPDVFFTEILPAVDTLAEVKTTLHIWWRLRCRDGRPMALRELLEDELLLKGLRGDPRPAADLIAEGVERAVERGVFLRVPMAEGGGNWLLANDAEGRRMASRLRAGDLEPEPLPFEPGSQTKRRPNIFGLYEQNVGLLQPLIVEQLREAEETYPASWIEDAFRIAVERNARNWRYIRAILERWKTEGKDDGTSGRDREKGRRRYIEGEFADYIEH